MKRAFRASAPPRPRIKNEELRTQTRVFFWDVALLCSMATACLVWSLKRRALFCCNWFHCEMITTSAAWTVRLISKGVSEGGGRLSRGKTPTLCTCDLEPPMISTRARTHCPVSAENTARAATRRILCSEMLEAEFAEATPTSQLMLSNCFSIEV